MIDTETIWETLRGKYIRLKDLRVISLSRDDDKIDAFVLDVHDKNVKLRFDGNKKESTFVLKEEYTLREKVFLGRYRFLRELTKWEKLEFDVGDYISGFYDDSDFNSKIEDKSKEECKYMQKFANFEMEDRLPIVKKAAFALIAFFFSVTLAYPPVVMNTNLSNFLVFILLLGGGLYIYYDLNRTRYHKLILMLETKILS